MISNNPTIPSLTRRQVREVDLRAIRDYRMSGLVLMENAGRGAAELLERLGIHGPVLICAGKGNNGGDGFVIARHLDQHGIEAPVLLFAEPDQLSGDAAANFQILQAARHPVQLLGTAPDRQRLDTLLAGADWIVDALLGTGTTGLVREPYLTAIQAINRAGKKILAVDLPSGLDCDTGQPLGECVRASHTVTFVARKVGFELPPAQLYTGIVHVAEIGVPRALIGEIVCQDE
jgi:NAD(P)H-hydrate epimerase